jgi:hypothetical protein
MRGGARETRVVAPGAYSPRQIKTTLTFFLNPFHHEDCSCRELAEVVVVPLGPSLRCTHIARLHHAHKIVPTLAPPEK